MPYGHFPVGGIPVRRAVGIRIATRPGLMARMGSGMLTAAGTAAQLYQQYSGQGPSTQPTAQYAGAGGMGYGRRRGRMNVCNPRALRRAIRRTHGFAKLAMKTIHLVHPKKRANFGGFKRKRRR